MSENETPTPPPPPGPGQTSQPPPYSQAPAPYTQVTDEQRRIWERKGKRGIGFGVAWAVAGLLITLITYSNASSAGGGVYIVAWGPVVYGVYRIVAGYLMLNKSRN